MPRLESACAETPVSRTVGELVVGGDFFHVHCDQPLEFALERMGTAGVDSLPVVARADVRKLVGIVVLKDILSVYGVTGVEKISGA
jgi:CBS domain-containing protein